MIVLGIETSCDETAAAVVRDGREVLSNVVFSQVHLHCPYGGVVPEIASRSHVEHLPATIKQAVADAGVGWDGIDAIAATYGPGLASSLLVGLAAGKGLALGLNKPLCLINHLEAHIYSVFVGSNAPDFAAICPFIALIVSGGHTALVRVEGLGRYVLLGQTIDDAAGEAFDKGANLLGLGYPGGPAIDKISRGGRVDFVRFPRGRQGKDRHRFPALNRELCFSFSGLKTSLLYYLKEHPLSGDADELSSLAASYQEAIVDALVSRCRKAVRTETHIAACGGVSMNSSLRARLAEMAADAGLTLWLAEPRYCADNATMIAGLAGAGQGMWGDEAMSADVNPNLPVAAPAT